MDDNDLGYESKGFRYYYGGHSDGYGGYNPTIHVTYAPGFGQLDPVFFHAIQETKSRLTDCYAPAQKFAEEQIESGMMSRRLAGLYKRIEPDDHLTAEE